MILVLFALAHVCSCTRIRAVASTSLEDTEQLGLRRHAGFWAVNKAAPWKLCVTHGGIASSWSINSTSWVPQLQDGAPNVDGVMCSTRLPDGRLWSFGGEKKVVWITDASRDTWVWSSTSYTTGPSPLGGAGSLSAGVCFYYDKQNAHSVMWISDVPGVEKELWQFHLHDFSWTLVPTTGVYPDTASGPGGYSALRNQFSWYSGDDSRHVYVLDLASRKWKQEGPSIDMLDGDDGFAPSWAKQESPMGVPHPLNWPPRDADICFPDDAAGLVCLFSPPGEGAQQSIFRRHASSGEWTWFGGTLYSSSDTPTWANNTFSARTGLSWATLNRFRFPIYGGVIEDVVRLIRVEVSCLRIQGANCGVSGVVRFSHEAVSDRAELDPDDITYLQVPQGRYHFADGMHLAGAVKFHAGRTVVTTGTNFTGNFTKILSPLTKRAGTCEIADGASAIVTRNATTMVFEWPLEQSCGVALETVEDEGPIDGDAYVTGELMVTQNVTVTGDLEWDEQVNTTVSSGSTIVVGGTVTLASGGLTLSDPPLNTPIVVVTGGNVTGTFGSLSATSSRPLRDCEQLVPVASYGATSVSVTVSLDSSTCTEEEFPLGAIIGITIGGIVLVLGALLLMAYLVRRKNHRLANELKLEMDMKQFSTAEEK